MILDKDCTNRDCASCPHHGSCIMESQMNSFAKAHMQTYKYLFAVELQQKKQQNRESPKKRPE